MEIPGKNNNLKRPPPSPSTTASNDIIRQQNMRGDSSAITHDTQKTAESEMDEDGFVTPVLSKKRPNKELKLNVGEKTVSNRKTADDILLPIKKSIDELSFEDHVSFDKLQGFLEKIRETLNIGDALQDFSDADTSKLIKTMEITHALSNDSLVKARLTRLKNKIGGKTAPLPNDSDSDNREIPETHSRSASFDGSVNGVSGWAE
ncbi:hypothetical protein QAD02_004897 [Eretmocerus hayati]|uniref:Uncharacterized protein n=1 Tax=Eretmocerus hayati TaxID=131215 RepID=A0ACC2NVP6_9HYME|nr:hypothetical protein QAD02_004897 [Eretmocerus hayati]